MSWQLLYKSFDGMMLALVSKNKCCLTLRLAHLRSTVLQSELAAHVLRCPARARQKQAEVRTCKVCLVFTSLPLSCVTV